LFSLAATEAIRILWSEPTEKIIMVYGDTSDERLHFCFQWIKCSRCVLKRDGESIFNFFFFMFPVFFFNCLIPEI